MPASKKASGFQSTRAKDRRMAAWIFGPISFVILICVLVLSPRELPPTSHQILGFITSLCAGFIGYFLTGNIKLDTAGRFGKWGKTRVQAGGGIAIFIFVILWWNSDYSRVRKQLQHLEKDVQKVQDGVQRIVSLLEGELRIKDQKIESLQNQLEGIKAQKPSLRAKELAGEIPITADDYALALKAIAEERYDEARTLLDRAAQKKEAQLIKIYLARGTTEYYSGNIPETLKWCGKAEALGLIDLDDLHQTLSIYYVCASYIAAERIGQKLLEIHRKQTPPDYQSVASIQSLLGAIYLDQARFADAEAQFREVLEISRKNFSSDYARVAVDYNNLASLYAAKGQYSDAENYFLQAIATWKMSSETNEAELAGTLISLAELYRKQKRYAEAVPLCENSLRLVINKPEYFEETLAGMNNLAQLYRDQNRYAEADALFQTALQMTTNSLGVEHPQAATIMNNLAQSYQRQGLYTNAEALLYQALEIKKKKLGDHHPGVASVLNNLGLLYAKQGRLPEAEQFYRQAISVAQVALGVEHPTTQLMRKNLVSNLTAQKIRSEIEARQLTNPEPLRVLFISD